MRIAVLVLVACMHPDPRIARGSATEIACGKSTCGANEVCLREQYNDVAEPVMTCKPLRDGCPRDEAPCGCEASYCDKFDTCHGAAAGIVDCSEDFRQR
jgi:hypothetical protein